MNIQLLLYSWVMIVGVFFIAAYFTCTKTFNSYEMASLLPYHSIFLTYLFASLKQINCKNISQSILTINGVNNCVIRIKIFFIFIQSSINLLYFYHVQFYRKPSLIIIIVAFSLSVNNNNIKKHYRHTHCRLKHKISLVNTFV